MLGTQDRAGAGAWAGAWAGAAAPGPFFEWYHISYHSKKGIQMALTASEARKRLFPLIEQVNEDRKPVEITSLRGDAVLLSKADYDELQETAFLLRVPQNAQRLLESLDEARRGKRDEHDLHA
jgi:antitoxin YefM